MADFETSYVFRLDIQGAEAVAKAQQIRQQIKDALGSKDDTAALEQAVRAATKALEEQVNSVKNLLSELTNLRRAEEEQATAARTAGKEGAAAYAEMAQQVGAVVGKVQELVEAQRKLQETTPAVPTQEQLLAMMNVSHQWEASFQRLQIPSTPENTLSYYESFINRLNDLKGQSDKPILGSELIPSTDELRENELQWAAFISRLRDLGKEEEDVNLRFLRSLGVLNDGIQANRRSLWEWLNTLSDAMNKATVEYFGLRRFGYGLAYAGVSLRMAGQNIMDTVNNCIEVFREFEQENRSVVATLGLTAEQATVFKDKVYELAETFGYFKAGDIALGLQRWQEATGIQIKSTDELTNTLETMVDVQRVALIQQDQLGRTAENVGAVMRAWDKDLSETRDVIEKLNYVATKSHVSFVELTQGMAKGAEVAKQSNTAFEEYAAILSMGAEAGYQISTVNSQLSLMMRAMLEPTKEYEDAWNRLLQSQLKPGQTWKDIVFPGGQFIGVPEVIDLISAGVEQLVSEGKIGLADAIIKELSSVRSGASVVNTLIKENIEARKQNVTAIQAEADLLNGLLSTEEQLYLQRKKNITDATGQVQTAARLYEENIQNIDRNFDVSANKIESHIENTQRRFGEVTAQAALRWKENIAIIQDMIVSVFEKYPGLAENLVSLGMTLSAVGSLFEVVGRIVGSATNFLIFKTAVDIFSASVGNQQGAVGMFSLAVKDFAVAVASHNAGGAVSEAAGPAVAGAAAGKATSGAVGGAAAVGFGTSMAIIAGIMTLLSDLQAGFGIEFEQVKALAEGRGRLGMIQATEDYLKRQGTLSNITNYPFTLPLLWEMALLRSPDIIRNLPKFLKTGNIFSLFKFEDKPRKLPDESPAASNPINLPSELFPSYTPGSKLPEWKENVLNVWDDYQERLLEAEENYKERSKELEEDLSKNKEKIRKDRDERLKKLDEDFALSESRYREDYLLDREKEFEKLAELDQEYKDEEYKRADEQRRRLEDLEHQHQTRMIDLLEARDVQGITKEMRDYLYQRQKLQEEGQIEKQEREKQYQDRRADLLKQIAEEDAEYERQAARRAEDHRRQEEEERKNAEERLAELEVRYNESLDRLKKQKGKEEAELARSAAVQLAEIYGVELGEKESQERRLQNAAKFFEQYRAIMEGKNQGANDPYSLPSARAPWRYNPVNSSTMNLLNPFSNPAMSILNQNAPQIYVDMRGMTISSDVSVEAANKLKGAITDAVVEQMGSIFNTLYIARGR